MVAGGSGGSGGTDPNGYSPEIGGNGGTGGAGTAVAGVWPAGNGAAGQGGDGGDGGAGGQIPNGQSTVGGSAGTLTANGGGGGGAGGYFGGAGGQAGTAGLIGTATPAAVAAAARRMPIPHLSPTRPRRLPTTSSQPRRRSTGSTSPPHPSVPSWQTRPRSSSWWRRFPTLRSRRPGRSPTGRSRRPRLEHERALTGTPTKPGHYSFTVTVTAQPNAVATSTRTYTGSVASQVPGVPTNVQGQPGYESVTLTWTPPTTTGGEAITGYSVRYSTDGGFSWTVATPNTFSTATSYTVTGLTSGGGYQFEVAAINGVGTGAWSAASATVTPILDPSAPVGLIAVAGNAKRALSWQRPSTGNVTGYRIEAQEGSATIILNENTRTAATTYQATGLVNGKTYRFRVAAIDQTAVGPYSALSNAVVPAAPSSVVAVQVLDDLVITVNGGATAYFRTTAGRIEVAANRAFTSAQQFDPATVTDVIVSGNTGLGGFVFTAARLPPTSRQRASDRSRSKLALSPPAPCRPRSRRGRLWSRARSAASAASRSMPTCGWQTTSRSMAARAT